MNEMPKIVSRKRETVKEMAPVTSEQIRLFSAKDALDKEIDHLQTLHELALEGEERDKIAEEIKQLEANRGKILESLGQARPEEYADEAAFEKLLNAPIRTVDKAKAEKIAATVNEKDRLEEASYSLEGKLRLKDKYTQAEIGEMQETLKKTHEARLAAWQQLSDLDPARFQAAAVKEISEAADSAKIDAIRASINPDKK
jgi:hypothetical protein